MSQLRVAAVELEQAGKAIGCTGHRGLQGLDLTRATTPYASTSTSRLPFRADTFATSTVRKLRTISACGRPRLRSLRRTDAEEGGVAGSQVLDTELVWKVYCACCGPSENDHSFCSI